MYIYTHKSIRNDDHCPICRRYYISVHNTFDEAYTEAAQDIDSEYLEDLREDQVLWIDEWVRRSNGDKYHIFKITLDKEYDLHDYNINIKDDIYDLHDYNINKKDDVEDNNKENSNQVDDKDIKIYENNELYMFLHVNVKKFEWCPDNINYKISFYKTLDSACENGNQFLETLEEENKLRKLESIWINNKNYDVSKGNGDHYQIIKLENNKVIELNKYCAQVQPEAW